VRTVVTDFALLDVEPDGFVLREVAPGVTVDDVRRLTAAPLRVDPNVREMTFA
jgi:3-oxoacid CoA-transferase subunit B